MNNLMKKIKRLNVYRVMIASLLIIVGASYLTEPNHTGLYSIIAAAATGLILDTLIQGIKNKKFTEVSETGLIIGLIIGIVAAPEILITAAITVIAIVSKYLIRYKSRPVFNPANLGILLSVFIGGASSWWAAVQVPVVVGVLGLFIAWKIKRLYSSLSFLAVSVLTAIAFMGDPLQGLTLTLNGATLFLGLFMLVEPKTSPSKKNSQLIYGSLVGLVLFLTSLPGITLLPMISVMGAHIALAVGNLARTKLK